MLTFRTPSQEYHILLSVSLFFLFPIHKSDTSGGINLLQYPWKISALLIIHFADGRDKIFGNLSGRRNAAVRALRSLIFAGTLGTLSSREKRSGIYREGTAKRKCPTCKMQRRVGNSPPLSFVFSPSARP